MGLKALFRKMTGKRESVYDAIERLMTPNLVALMAERSVASARAQIRANLKLGQREQAGEACERVLKVLSAYQLNAEEHAGDVLYLRAIILMEAERFEEARRAFASIADGKVTVADEELKLFAQVGMDSIRKRLQSRLDQIDEEAPHFCSFYTCLKCGRLKLFLSAPCETCLDRPRSDDAIASSMICCSDNQDFGFMLAIGAGRRAGKEISGIAPDLASFVREAKDKPLFRSIADQVLASTDERTTRLSDFTTCPRCKAELEMSMQDDCSCGASLKLPARQRLLVSLNILIREVEIRWNLPRKWASLEWVSVLLWARYFLLVHRQVPDPDMQVYLRCLLPKVGVLLDREDRGFVQFDEQGKPTIIVKTKSESELTLLTIYFTLFNVELHSMTKHMEDSSLS